MLKRCDEVLDPYRAWLDVDAPDRPLNLYQLLGLPPGEDDVKAIEDAVRRKRDLLRRCAQDAVPVLWRRLHQELNEADQTLRDPKKKADYDRALFLAGVRTAEHRPDGPLACGGCGEKNPPTRGFCARCGQPLLAPCAQCGARNAASETYCGGCGAHLASALERRIEEFQTRLQTAEALQVAGRFDEALVLLSGMLSTAIPRLEEHVARAKEMLRLLPQRRRRAEQAYREAIEQARALFEAQEYGDALKTLERTPPGLRDEDEFKPLYRVCRSRHDEAIGLAHEIRAALAAKETAGLLEKVERLLELKPGHPQASRLREQLLALRFRTESKAGAELRRQAQALLAQHKFREAVETLEQTPPRVREDAFQKLYDFAREAAWLEETLQTAPAADRALLHAAQRLARLVPKHKAAAEWALEVEAAIRQGPADPRHAAPRWRASRPTLRRPVVWLGGFGRLQPNANCPSELLRKHPGRFYVACGLALHGLDEAAVGVNLLPRKKKGVLESLSRLSRKAAPPAAAWGLDLSASGLKAVRLVRGGEQAEIQIDACVFQEHGFDAAPPASEEAMRAALRRSLEELLAGRNLGEDRVCVAVGGIPTLGRFFRLPLIDEAKLADAVAFEARHQFPVPLEELVWDFHAFPPPEHPGGPQAPEREVAVLAARRRQLQPVLAVLEEIGFDVHAFQSDCTALDNFLRYELADELPQTDPAANGGALEPVCGLLDVGREASSFLAVSPWSTFFRSFPLGGDAFTKALVREFRLTFQEAERLKRAPWQARSMRQWDEAFAAVAAQLVEELRRCETLLGRHRRLERLYVTGGGAQLHGLLRRLSQ